MFFNQIMQQILMQVHSANHFISKILHFNVLLKFLPKLIVELSQFFDNLGLKASYYLGNSRKNEKQAFTDDA